MTDPVLAMFVLLILLTVKHLIADFALQSRNMLEKRRFYGHPSGLLHVGIHLAGTLLSLLFVGTTALIIMMMLILEGLLHYHIDWAKDNLLIRLSLSPDQRGYWVALGADQMLHHMTYIGLAAWWYLAV